MKLLKKQHFLFLTLLFSLPAHSFWGEKHIRSCLRWLYFSRISQFILQKFTYSSIKKPVDIIKILLKQQDNLTFLNKLSDNDQKTILTDSIYNKLTNQDKENQLTTVTKLYEKDNLFSLATVYSILDQFINTQKQFLANNNFTVSNDICTKDLVINNLFDNQNPSFYTERRILEPNAETYLAADLHGDPSPVFDILQNIYSKGKFDENTGIIKPDTYLSFNGDFVDKGINGSLCLLLIYSLKILNPNQIIITRGNHEDPDCLKIASIGINTKYDSKTLFDFGTELYYKYYANISQIMNFMFPADDLLNKISQSYAVMPVMAFVLHKTNTNKLVGYVASHAGLDPAYNPKDLFEQQIDQPILFDQYQTERKLNPRNNNFRDALIEEMIESSDEYQNTVQDHINRQITSRKAELKKYTQLNAEISASITALDKLKNSNLNLSNYLYLSLINGQKTTFFDEKINSVISKGDIPTLTEIPFDPFFCLPFVKNCIHYFENPIKSIKDVAACWHWKEPHIKSPSSFKASVCSVHFNMSNKAFGALMRDYTQQTPHITLSLATQGHIQSAGLAFNELYGFNQKSIINNWGYGDSWDQEEQSITENQRHTIKSHKIFNTKTFDIPSNPCIAASCGSLYGCAQDQEEFNEYMKKNQNHISPDYPYPGQWYNPIISLFYNHETGRMNAHQALVWHKNQEEL